jgi:alpha/beta superfamily hydrolase
MTDIKPMPASALVRRFIPGAMGRIETDIHDPGAGTRRGIAVIAHPNPVQGGTKDNKVVTTLAKCFYSLGCVVARPNFRGVGQTDGTHDAGNGETDDIVSVVNHMETEYPGLPVTLAGFSFGCFVQSRVVKRVAARQLVLIAPAVNRFETEPVPADTLVIHGEIDDVVPLADVMVWARPQNLPVVVIPGGEHFFHGRLSQLANIVVRYCR